MRAAVCYALWSTALQGVTRPWHQDRSSHLLGVGQQIDALHVAVGAAANLEQTELALQGRDERLQATGARTRPGGAGEPPLTRRVSGGHTSSPALHCTAPCHISGVGTPWQEAQATAAGVPLAGPPPRRRVPRGWVGWTGARKARGRRRKGRAAHPRRALEDVVHLVRVGVQVVQLVPRGKLDVLRAREGEIHGGPWAWAWVEGAGWGGRRRPPPSRCCGAGRRRRGTGSGECGQEAVRHSREGSGERRPPSASAASPWHVHLALLPRKALSQPSRRNQRKLHGTAALLYCAPPTLYLWCLSW